MIKRLRLALRLPVHVVARRAAGLVRRRLEAALAHGRDIRRPTFAPAPAGALRRLLASPSRQELAAQQDWLRPLAALHRDGWVDLLGSGWVRPHHGMTCAGTEGHAYPPAAILGSDGLAGRINGANLAQSRRIWSLIDPQWQPMDWQLDFKSGWRWSETQWYGHIAFGHAAGADIKVPWELARMQHLLVLAWSFALDGDAADARAFRNQVLDFIATNPPRFGVNWRCAMDVAIRAANWVVAFDLFRAAGHVFDTDFEQVLAASLTDHGRHIVSHLEWYPEGRGNHYLADICGLAFIAAMLPPSAEGDAWLAFAAQELETEAAHQVLSDGAGFEASTCYHRLSGEMIVFTAALLAGRTDEGRAADPSALTTRPHRPLRPGHRPDLGALRRLAGCMAAFTRAVTRPDGRVAQIGDNDSGRFFRAHPVLIRRKAAEARALYANLEFWRGLDDGAVYWDEDLLDHRPFAAAAEAFAGHPGGGDWLDALLVRLLCPAPAAAAPHIPAARMDGEGSAPDGECRRIEIRCPGEALDQDLETLAFPEFGVFIMKSKRVWLSLRCGAIGLNGRGGHAHNDQLALELCIDGEDWLSDPGAYLYTADRRWRNAYRSVAAHAAPVAGPREPGRLDLGDFWLGDEAKARCLSFGPEGFDGLHHGFGAPVRRRVRLTAQAIIVEDYGLGPGHVTLDGREDLRAYFSCSVPFSPGYGKRLRSCAS